MATEKRKTKHKVTVIRSGERVVIPANMEFDFTLAEIEDFDKFDALEPKAKPKPKVEVAPAKAAAAKAPAKAAAAKASATDTPKAAE